MHSVHLDFKKSKDFSRSGHLTDASKFPARCLDISGLSKGVRSLGWVLPVRPTRKSRRIPPMYNTYVEVPTYAKQTCRLLLLFSVFPRTGQNCRLCEPADHAQAAHRLQTMVVKKWRLGVWTSHSSAVSTNSWSTSLFMSSCITYRLSLPPPLYSPWMPTALSRPPRLPWWSGHPACLWMLKLWHFLQSGSGMDHPQVSV